MEINATCNKLLVALSEVGYNEHTIYNYQGVIRRFKAFSEENGFNDYTPELGQLYADNVISKKTGKFSANRYHTQGRFIRLIDSYYNAGIFDFSTIKRGKVQPSSEFFRIIYQEYQDYLYATYDNNNTIHFFGYELYCLLRYLEEMNVFSLDNLICINCIGLYKIY